LLGTDVTHIVDERGFFESFFNGDSLLFRKVFLEEENDQHVLGEFLRGVEKIVRERKKNSKNQKGKADGGDRENIASPVLPEISERFFG
jgi:hypothetical protein